MFILIVFGTWNTLRCNLFRVALIYLASLGIAGFITGSYIIPVSQRKLYGYNNNVFGRRHGARRFHQRKLYNAGFIRRSYIMHWNPEHNTIKPVMIVNPSRSVIPPYIPVIIHFLTTAWPVNMCQVLSALEPVFALFKPLMPDGVNAEPLFRYHYGRSTFTFEVNWSRLTSPTLRHQPFRPQRLAVS